MALLLRDLHQYPHYQPCLRYLLHHIYLSKYSGLLRQVLHQYQHYLLYLRYLLLRTCRAKYMEQHHLK